MGESRPAYRELMIFETLMMFAAFDLYKPAVRMHSMISATLALESVRGVTRNLLLSFLIAALLLRSFVFCDRIVWIRV